MAQTVDQLVTTINGNASLADKIRASNDGGKLRIENLSTENLSVVGATATAVNGGTGGSNTQTIGGNEVRKNLITQFNDLRRQLDKLSDDASFNGINLLKADKLKITFNEIGTSYIEVQAKNVNGVVRGISTEAASLNIGAADATEFSERLPTRRPARQAVRCAHDRSDAIVVLRLQPRDGADPSGVHAVDDRHPAVRRRQPDARRLERGRREPARPQHPPAARRRPPSRSRARPRRRCCACSDPSRRKHHGTAGQVPAVSFLALRPDAKNGDLPFISINKA